jgi:hypothetical protein
MTTHEVTNPIYQSEKINKIGLVTGGLVPTSLVDVMSEFQNSHTGRVHIHK